MDVLAFQEDERWKKKRVGGKALGGIIIDQQVYERLDIVLQIVDDVCSMCGNYLCPGDDRMIDDY